MKTAPAYLIIGPDFGRREQRVRAICDAVAQGEQEVDCKSYYADDFAVGELIALLYNRTLFHAHLVVVYRNVDAVRGKGAHDQLRDYIASPSEQATLIFVSEQTKISASWAKAIPKSQTTVCWQPFENEIRAIISNAFHKHGRKIAPDVIAYISEVCNNDSHLAEQLCQQIIYFFRHEEEITSELLFDYIDTRQSVSIFQLADSIFQRDINGATTTLNNLHLEQYHASRIAGFVNAQMQKLWRISYLIATGVPSGTAMKKNDVVWKRQIQSIQRGLSSFKLTELSRLVTRHKNLEAEIRELPDAYGYMLLTRLIAEVCAGISSPLAPASRRQIMW